MTPGGRPCWLIPVEVSVQPLVGVLTGTLTLSARPRRLSLSDSAGAGRLGWLAARHTCSGADISSQKVTGRSWHEAPDRPLCAPASVCWDSTTPAPNRMICVCDPRADMAGHAEVLHIPSGNHGERRQASGLGAKS